MTRKRQVRGIVRSLRGARVVDDEARRTDEVASVAVVDGSVVAIAVKEAALRILPAAIESQRLPDVLFEEVPPCIVW
jgi:hypothetical protein